MWLGSYRRQRNNLVTNSYLLAPRFGRPSTGSALKESNKAEEVGFLKSWTKNTCNLTELGANQSKYIDKGSKDSVAFYQDGQWVAWSLVWHLDLGPCTFQWAPSTRVHNWMAHEGGYCHASGQWGFDGLTCHYKALLECTFPTWLLPWTKHHNALKPAEKQNANRFIPKSFLDLQFWIFNPLTWFGLETSSGAMYGKVPRRSLQDTNVWNLCLDKPKSATLTWRVSPSPSTKRLSGFKSKWMTAGFCTGETHIHEKKIGSSWKRIQNRGTPARKLFWILPEHARRPYHETPAQRPGTVLWESDDALQPCHIHSVKSHQEVQFTLSSWVTRCNLYYYNKSAEESPDRFLNIIPLTRALLWSYICYHARQLMVFCSPQLPRQWSTTHKVCHNPCNYTLLVGGEAQVPGTF